MLSNVDNFSILWQGSFSYKQSLICKFIQNFTFIYFDLNIKKWI